MSLHARDVERDVRELSTLLGEVLSEQASPDALETVDRHTIAVPLAPTAGDSALLAISDNTIKPKRGSDSKVL
jgi:hypothetical protein